MARSAAAALLLVSALVTRPAQAQRPGLPAGSKQPEKATLSVSFDVLPAEAPEHVCVVAPYAAPDVLDLATLYRTLVGARAPATLTEGTWAFPRLNDEQARTALSTVADNDVGQAIRKLTAVSEDSGVACHDHERCRPALEVPAGIYGAGTKYMTMCSRNRSQSVRTGRVAFLEIAPEKTGDTLATSEITFDGNLASVTVSGAASASPISVKVIGGHYVVGARVSTSNDSRQVLLPLIRRCEPRRIELPPLGVGTSNDRTVNLTLRFQGSTSTPIWSCNQVPVDAERGIRVALPVVSTSELKTLRAETGNSQASGYARFILHWRSGIPDDGARMRVGVLSFKWRRHCMFPADACPTAQLAEFGVVCAGKPADDDRCEYTCGIPSSNDGQVGTEVEFDLPSLVTFSWTDAPVAAKGTALTAENDVAARDVWSVHLMFPNQLLTDYLPEEDRRFDLDLSAWADSDEQLRERVKRTQDSIAQVELMLPNGATRRIRPQRRHQRVPLSGVQCGDVVGFRLRGSRVYEEQTAELRAGAVPIPPPGDTVRWWRWWLQVEAGGAFSAALSGVPGATTKSLHSEPIAGGEPTLELRGPDWPVWMEFKAGAWLSRREYFPASVGSWERSAEFVPEGSRQTEPVLYARFPVGFQGVVPLSDGFLGGVGAGLLWGHPVYQDDEAAVGGWDTAGWLSVFSRARLTEHVWATGKLQVVGKEQVYAFQTDNRGAPRVARGSMLAFPLTFGIMTAL